MASQRRQAAKRSVRARPRLGTDRSLGSIVDEDTYAVWVKMLATLVPSGRTHRLAPLVGGMLQYAAYVAHQRFRQKPAEGSAAASLMDALESADPKAAVDELSDVVEDLFRSAKVKHSRRNSRGDDYSIIDAAVAEFVNWDAMPWE